jgi:hypothetical protein
MKKIGRYYTCNPSAASGSHVFTVVELFPYDSVRVSDIFRNFWGTGAIKRGFAKVHSQTNDCYYIVPRANLKKIS